jgi:outer membrane protein, heavy metal efflux system
MQPPGTYTSDHGKSSFFHPAMTVKRRGWPAATLVVASCLAACATLPPRAPADPSHDAEAFAARRLNGSVQDLPPAVSGWNREEWFRAALALNPQLAETRAAALAVAAGERTAAERPNPTLNLFGEYVTAAATSAAWLYGLSLDFLLPRRGERSRAMAGASLQTEAAQADVEEAIWQVRSEVRQALLDANYAHDEAALLATVVTDREALLASNRALATAGEIAQSETLTEELELARARQRLARAQALASDATVRLAAAVGVSSAALDGIPLHWEDWADISALAMAPREEWRSAALIGRPQLVHALREYDLTDIALQTEVSKRWPQFHVSPGYAWDKSGLRQDTLDDTLHDTLHDNEVGVSFELPVFNRHEGPIGEALARRKLAGEHLHAVQAQLFEEIERAETAWPQAEQAWRAADAAGALARRQSASQERAFTAGATDRPALIAARLEATETELITLESAYNAQLAFAALESAYRRPLQGGEIPLSASLQSKVQL